MTSRHARARCRRLTPPPSSAHSPYALSSPTSSPSTITSTAHAVPPARPANALTGSARPPCTSRPLTESAANGLCLAHTTHARASRRCASAAHGWRTPPLTPPTTARLARLPHRPPRHRHATSPSPPLSPSMNPATRSRSCHTLPTAGDSRSPHAPRLRLHAASASTRQPNTPRLTRPLSGAASP